MQTSKYTLSQWAEEIALQKGREIQYNNPTNKKIIRFMSQLKEGYKTWREFAYDPLKDELINIY